MNNSTSSRFLAKQWPIPRHSAFVKELREAAMLWFSKNDFDTHTKMPYCLDKKANWKNNIILPEVSNYIEISKKSRKKERKPFPLHNYIHHGLSSQAMVFNLIGPLITRNDLTPLIEVFKSKGLNNLDSIVSAKFEFEDRDVFNEDTGQPTSLDVALFNENKKPILLIESKLVESEFGGCSVFKKGDCPGKNPAINKPTCFLHFIGRKYWDLMDKYGFTEKLKDEKICIFINYYQFFREVLLSLEKNAAFALLYDERGPVFNYETNGHKTGLIPFLIDFVPAKHQNKIVLISIQDVIKSISKSHKHKDWIDEFKLKYGL